MSAETIAIPAMAGLLSCSAIFSAGETALFSLRTQDLDKFDGDKSDRVSWLLDNSQHTLLTILISNNIINITYFALASWWANSYGDASSIALISIGSLMALIICGEIIPKVLASGNPIGSSSLLERPIGFTVGSFMPLSRFVIKILGDTITSDRDNTNDLISNEELIHVIDQSHEHGVVSERAHDRLLDIVSMSEKPVEQIMTHRVDCPIVDVQDNMETAVEVLNSNPGAWILVVDSEENEDCVGILAAQDVLRGGKIKKRMRKPVYIPESCNIPQAIDLLRDRKKSVAVVVDEYGATAGLLTLAHLGNSLLGQGLSEDVPSLDDPQRIGPNQWQLPGQMPISAWERLLEGADIEDCTTIGGFIIQTLGRVPVIGDRVLFRNLQFEVAKMENNRISTLILWQLTQQEARRITRQHRAGVAQ